MVLQKLDKLYKDAIDHPVMKGYEHAPEAADIVEHANKDAVDALTDVDAIQNEVTLLQKAQTVNEFMSRMFGFWNDSRFVGKNNIQEQDIGPFIDKVEKILKLRNEYREKYETMLIKKIFNSLKDRLKEAPVSRMLIKNLLAEYVDDFKILEKYEVAHIGDQGDDHNKWVAFQAIFMDACNVLKDEGLVDLDGIEAIRLSLTGKNQLDEEKKNKKKKKKKMKKNKLIKEQLKIEKGKLKELKKQNKLAKKALKKQNDTSKQTANVLTTDQDETAPSASIPLAAAMTAGGGDGTADNIDNEDNADGNTDLIVPEIPQAELAPTESVEKYQVNPDKIDPLPERTDIHNLVTNKLLNSNNAVLDIETLYGELILEYGFLADPSSSPNSKELGGYLYGKEMMSPFSKIFDSILKGLKTNFVVILIEGPSGTLDRVQRVDNAYVLCDVLEARILALMGADTENGKKWYQNALQNGDLSAEVKHAFLKAAHDMSPYTGVINKDLAVMLNAGSKNKIYSDWWMLLVQKMKKEYSQFEGLFDTNNKDEEVYGKNPNNGEEYPTQKVKFSGRSVDISLGSLDGYLIIPTERYDSAVKEYTSEDGKSIISTDVNLVTAGRGSKLKIIDKKKKIVDQKSYSIDVNTNTITFTEPHTLEFPLEITFMLEGQASYISELGGIQEGMRKYTSGLVLESDGIDGRETLIKNHLLHFETQKALREANTLSVIQKAIFDKCASNTNPHTGLAVKKVLESSPGSMNLTQDDPGYGFDGRNFTYLLALIADYVSQNLSIKEPDKLIVMINGFIKKPKFEDKFLDNIAVFVQKYMTGRHTTQGIRIENMSDRGFITEGDERTYGLDMEGHKIDPYYFSLGKKGSSDYKKNFTSPSTLEYKNINVDFTNDGGFVTLKITIPNFESIEESGNIHTIRSKLLGGFGKKLEELDYGLQYQLLMYLEKSIVENLTSNIGRVQATISGTQYRVISKNGEIQIFAYDSFTPEWTLQSDSSQAITSGGRDAHVFLQLLGKITDQIQLDQAEHYDDNNFYNDPDYDPDGLTNISKQTNVFTKHDYPIGSPDFTYESLLSFKLASQDILGSLDLNDNLNDHSDMVRYPSIKKDYLLNGKKITVSINHKGADTEKYSNLQNPGEHILHINYNNEDYVFTSMRDLLDYDRTEAEFGNGILPVLVSFHNDLLHHMVVSHGAFQANEIYVDREYGFSGDRFGIMKTADGKLHYARLPSEFDIYSGTANDDFLTLSNKDGNRSQKYICSNPYLYNSFLARAGLTCKNLPADKAFRQEKVESLEKKKPKEQSFKDGVLDMFGSFLNSKMRD